MISQEDALFFETLTQSKVAKTKEPTEVETEAKQTKAGFPDEMWNKIHKGLPHFPLKKEVLDDAVAIKVANLWKEDLGEVQVALIHFGEVGAALELLNNIAKAIDSLYVCAKVIDGARFEKENKWPLFFDTSHLKLVITTEMASWKKTSLLEFYTENPAVPAQFLNKRPLITLEKTTSYLTNHDLKRGLWKAIVSHLSS